MSMSRMAGGSLILRSMTLLISSTALYNHLYPFIHVYTQNQVYKGINGYKLHNALFLKRFPYKIYFLGFIRKNLIYQILDYKHGKKSLAPHFSSS